MLTRLDIINQMICSTGAGALTAEQSSHPLYRKAEVILSQVSQTVLALGLYFNTECRCIQPQTNGEIIVPAGCMKADPADRMYNLTLRGSRMYDLNAATYNIGKGVRLKMVFNLPLEEMPFAAQDYIRLRAVHHFYRDEDGVDPKLSDYRRDRDIGWSTLWREHIRSKQVNVFDNPSNTVSKLRRGVRNRIG